MPLFFITTTLDKTKKPKKEIKQNRVEKIIENIESKGRNVTLEDMKELDDFLNHPELYKVLENDHLYKYYDTISNSIEDEEDTEEDVDDDQDGNSTSVSVTFAAEDFNANV